MSDSPFDILVAVGEDGYGPSALASYVVKELHLRTSAKFCIWNASRYKYNKDLYKACVRVECRRIWNLFQLAKPNGEVSIPRTLERVGDYRTMSDLYGQGMMERFNLVLDFGVSAAAKWARQQDIPSVSIFDHSWCKTMRMILEDEDKNRAGERRESDDFRSRWHDLADAIERDEAKTERLCLFPDYITPPVFVDHWKKVLETEEVKAVEDATGAGAGHRIWQMKAVLCDPGLPDEESAKKTLYRLVKKELADEGLELHDKTNVLVQCGDTPVWDEPIKTLVKRLAEVADPDRKKLVERGARLVVNIPARIKEEVSFDYPDVAVPLPVVEGGTVQKILPAIDFQFGRAGGGSVNDAIACGVPFVCVEEKTMSQVEAILKACEDKEITERVKFEEFKQNPLGTIVKRLGDRKEQKEKIAAEPTDGAAALAKHIIAAYDIPSQDGND